MYILFLLSFATLVSGPAIVYAVSHNRAALRFIDAFFLCAIVGLILFDVLPHSLMHGGFAALAATALGFTAPFLLSHLAKLKTCQIHRSIISLASLGLIAHSILDGFALSQASAPNNERGLFLATAVVLHRLPEGIAIWRVTRPKLGHNFYMLTLFMIFAATFVGFFFGGKIVTHTSEHALIVFQAFTAGTLLHLIFHRHDDHDAKIQMEKWHLSTVSGAICGILSVASLNFLHMVAHVH